jgi:hypothetical protein
MSASLRVYGVAAALPWSTLPAALAKLRRHQPEVLCARLAQRRHMQAPVSHRTLVPVPVRNLMRFDWESVAGSSVPRLQLARASREHA